MYVIIYYYCIMFISIYFINTFIDISRTIDTIYSTINIHIGPGITDRIQGEYIYQNKE